MTSATPTCRACGSTQLTLRGKKLGEFIREEFAFHTCRDCELLFVEPFSGFEIYNDAYYRGQGPDPFVDYATEYRDYRCTDRALEFADLARLAESHLALSPSPPLSDVPLPRSPALARLRLRRRRLPQISPRARRARRPPARAHRPRRRFLRHPPQIHRRFPHPRLRRNHPRAVRDLRCDQYDRGH